MNCEGRFLGRRPGLAMLLLLPLCGCLQTKDELTLEADGSGKVRLETRVLVSSDLLSGMTMGMRMGGNEPIIYPPVSETEAKRLFPAKDFKVDVKTEGRGGELARVGAARDQHPPVARRVDVSRAHVVVVRFGHRSGRKIC